jgi:8-oxo-dGTP pyrophosphatase MutT (NUDIX family)
MERITETAAGGVLYRRGPAGLEMVVGEQTDRLTGAHTHRLPKGKIGRRETLQQAALREVLEETGLAARIVAPLGRVEYTYLDSGVDVAKVVHFFLMEWVPGDAATPDGELERIVWLPLEEARGVLTYEREREVVDRAIAELAPQRRG